eukprot:TRINITY_DN19117_c0_g1_i1.p1 TRINITY_DN19117_c0_g1~~TRINITY_DN19117_c0_g1_i1.p1  ORF type:complete len:495 (+),score=121.76 TRINITY_DN19117_c0_g1_i1:211-1485(+)
MALDPSLSEPQKQNLHLMQDCGSSLQQILNDILDFSKIEANQLRIENVEFEPEQLLDNTGRFYKSRAASKNLDLQCSYKKSQKRVVGNRKLLGDPTRIKQVLWNLVDNAIKFSPCGNVNVNVGEFHCIEDFVVERDRKMLEDAKFDLLAENELIWFCEICDCGEGIPAEMLRRIFDPFEQVDSSCTRKHGGTGLGLSIVKQILKLMGGVISAESEVGKGSRFWIALRLTMGHPELKYEEPSPTSTASSGTSSRRSSLEKISRRVLVAEDNKMIRTMVGKRLTLLGHRPVLTCDGQEAIDELKKSIEKGGEEDQFDVFLCDMFMPVKDGATALHEVRTTFPEPVRSMPIIAFTADVLVESVSRYLKCGADAVIGKPVDWKRLEDLLQDPPRDSWKRRNSAELEMSEDEVLLKRPRLAQVSELTEV